MLIPVMLLFILAGFLIGQATFVRPSTVLELVETPECTLPCWNGIIPGETRIADAHHTLLEGNYRESGRLFGNTNLYNYEPTIPGRCEAQLNVQSDSRVFRIHLHECPPLRLGDIIQILGQPEGVLAERFTLVFRGGTVLIQAQRTDCERRYTPNTFVGAIDLREPNSAIPTNYLWRGFIDLRFYMPRSTLDLNC